MFLYKLGGSMHYREEIGELRILAIEDDQADLLLLRHHLLNPAQAARIRLTTAEGLSEAFEILAQEKFELILMDLNVSDSQGLDTFVKVHELYPSLPVIILSGLNDETVAITAVKAGAQDYFPKSELNTFRLMKTISYAIERASLLQQALEGQEAAKKASQHKTDFLAHMSHEIRTPMNGVIGMTSLLAETVLTSEQEHYVATIRRSSQILMNIINDILDLSKIEAGKMQLEPTVFNVRQIIEETLELYAEMAHSKNLVLANIVDPALASELLGDDSRLRQVLGNLVSNALKFTDKGFVNVRAQLVPGTTNRVRFSVEDSGRGISRESSQKLFQPFTQLKDSPKSVTGGTGLGLVICRRLVELMGGSIEVESEINRGTTFSIEIPFQDLQARENPRGNLRGKRILVLAKDASSAEILTQQLRLRGILSQLIGEETSIQKELALGASNQQAYDLLLVDAHQAQTIESASLQGLEISILLLTSPASAGGQKFDGLKNAFELRVPFKQSALYEQLASILCGQEGNNEAIILPQTSKVLFKSGSRILIADDSSVNQQVASKMVSKLGLQCDVVSNGLEALRAIESGQYALVLMDCQMPEMDGFEATEAIRTLAGPKSQIPIIAMTANAMKTYGERCLEVGMNEVLTKPVVLDELRTVLGPYFSQKLSRPEPRQEQKLQSADAKKPIDAAVIRAFYEGSDKVETDQFVNNLIDLFVDIVPPTIEKLCEAVASQNIRAVAAYSHKLKGTCRNIGARELAASCQSLEEMAENKTISAAGEIASRLLKEFEAAKAELLKTYHNKGRASRSA